MAPAQTQGFLDTLPPEARARLVDGSGISAALAARTGAPLPVIVEFVRPALPDGVQAGSAEGDARVAAAIAAAQDALLGRVLQAGGLDAPQAERIDLRRMVNLPMLALTADAATIARLAQDPAVTRIWADTAEPPALTQSLPLIQQPAAMDLGATGNGQVVAILDSGVRRTHEFLSSRYLAGACFNGTTGGATSRCPGGGTSSFTLAAGDDCTTSTVYGCGHGTHVAGIVAGVRANPEPGNPASGVAPSARIISYNVFSIYGPSDCGSLPAGFNQCILARISDQIAALDHIYGRRSEFPIAAVNMSLGGGTHSAACNSDARRAVIQQLRGVGIAVIAATGNNGFNDAVNSPACIPETISVGSVTVQDVRSSFSNWGTLTDVAAPGSAIRSSYISGSSDTFYSNLSGTSMATPHVAGAFAAIRSLRPDATVDQIEAALRSTGTGISFAGVTVPRINMSQALGALGAGTATTASLSGPSTAVVGQPATFSVTVSGTGGGIPQGTVVLRRNGTEVGSGPLNGAGQASITTYSLTVGAMTMQAIYSGGNGFIGSSSETITTTVTAPPVPVNDNFADRILIPSPGIYAGYNVGATREDGEPVHWGSNPRDYSIWWTFTPTASGPAQVETCGSSFDTVLSVYTGTAVDGLTPVINNDDACGSRSRVEWQAVAGQSYAIAVASYSTSSFGDIIVTANFPYTPPVATTTALSGPNTGQTGQNLTYTATVTAAAGTPGGAVSFRRGGTQFATGTLNGAGQATGTGSFAAGTHQITAHYLGSAGFAASASAARPVTITQAPPATLVEFQGGGTVFNLSDACAAGGWANTAHPVRLRYGPGELNGYPTQVSLLWPTGSEHLAVWQPLAASTANFEALGRQMWSFFVLQPTRPRLTPVQRVITQPAGGTNMATAQQVMLRLRVVNFGGITGCAATIAGTVRRTAG